MRHAVITGASQGLGRALIDAFLKRGHRVSFCARRPDRIDAAVAELTSTGFGERVLGYVADVTVRAEVVGFWQALNARFGPVSVWINNAGYARGGPSFCELPDAEFANMLATNLLGTATACKVALAGLHTRGSGSLYNVVGAGADGRYVPGMLGYATTKCALQFLTSGLAAEHQDKAVIIGTVSPGLVLTEAVARELARAPSAMRSARLLRMNMIAELPLASAEWIADRTTDNKRNGARLVWLTRRRLLARRLFARFKPRDVAEKWARSGVVQTTPKQS